MTTSSGGIGHERDVSGSRILELIDEVVQKGGSAWVKWTCPGCGERATAHEPNVLHMDGYVHEEKSDGTPCGAWYHGKVFGLFVMLPLRPGYAVRDGVLH